MPESEKVGGGAVPWRYLLLFDLFLFALLVLSTRLATLLHELLGHGLTAAALGGAVRGIRVSLFGGGNAYYQFHAELDPTALFAVSFGGILINLLTGASALALATRPGVYRGRTVFLSVFGMVSLWGGLAYSSLGFYYGVGDPAVAVRGLAGAGEWLWLPFLAAAPAAAFWGGRAFTRVIRSWFPMDGFARKTLLLALTLGVTGAVYAGIYIAAEQRSVALETASIAQMRAEEKIRAEKRAEHRRQLRQTHPEWTEEELARALERVTLEVHPEEVPRKPPLIPLLAVAYLAGFLLSIHRSEESRPPVPRISPLVAFSSTLLAVAVLAVLVVTDGWIWIPS
jgi:hypothetical protein